MSAAAMLPAAAHDVAAAPPMGGAQAACAAPDLDAAKLSAIDELLNKGLSPEEVCDQACAARGAAWRGASAICSTPLARPAGAKPWPSKPSRLALYATLCTQTFLARSTSKPVRPTNRSAGWHACT
eukprot:351938-Chlamydomonas_euryale.AAC.3